MNFHYRYPLGVRSHPFISIDSQLPSWKSFELIFPKFPLPLPSWNVFWIRKLISSNMTVHSSQKRLHTYFLFLELVFRKKIHFSYKKWFTGINFQKSHITYSFAIQRIAWKNCLGIMFLENLISVTWNNVFGINFAIISGWGAKRREARQLKPQQERVQLKGVLCKQKGSGSCCRALVSPSGALGSPYRPSVPLTGGPF